MNEQSNFQVVVRAPDGDLRAAASAGNCTGIVLLQPGQYLLTFGSGGPPVAPPGPLIGAAGHRSQFEIFGLMPAAASFEPGAQ
jgi:hypothetical protein